MASFCESCGAKLEAGARFCAGCGRALQATPPAGVGPPSAPPPAAPPPAAPVTPSTAQPAQPWASQQVAPPAAQPWAPQAPAQPWVAQQPAQPWAPGGVAAAPRGSSRLPRIIGILVVLAIAVVAVAMLATAGPADAVEAHLAALARGDDAAAYAYTSAGFRGTTSLAQFTAFADANPIFRTAKATVTSRTVSGDSASVEVDLVPPAGAKRTAEFLLVKEGDDWKIIGYELRAG